MLLSELVRASAELAATRSRKAKIALLAAVLRAAEMAELPTVIAYLTGQTAQDRLGAGWRTLAGLGAGSAPDPVATVLEVDSALTEAAGVAAGTGSSTRRQEVLRALFERLPNLFAQCLDPP